MGSSKKHKDKHSKKERKRRRSRSRSRSRERDDDRRKHSRYSSGEEENYADDISKFVSKSRSETDTFETRIEKDRTEHEKRRDRDYQDEVDRKWRENRKQRDSEASLETTVKKEPNESIQPSSSGGDLSLSIEETNKLRLKLGLKPLAVDGAEDSGEKGYADRDDVHMPAKNISEEKEAAKLKRKMEELREKRLMRKKLEKVKPIAEDDDPILESASSWVQKSRQIDREKKLAEERAKQLEAMDEEFGISNLTSEMFSQGNKKKGYTSRDLKGLKIEHEASSFQTDGPVVLTLKDKGILEDDNEDVLINVNINDDEKTKENVENRKHKPSYKAYDDAEDDTAMFKARGVLEKYDDEIDGKKAKSFVIGSHGNANLDGNSELQRIKDEMKAHQVSLEGFKPVLAKDFYTEEEMVKFNKPKKRRKVRKRIVKADDLVPLVDDYKADLGSRTKRTSKPSSNSEVSSQNPTAMEMDMDLDSDIHSVKIERPEQNDRVTYEEDEAELELQMALKRSRRRTLKKTSKPEEIAMAVQATDEAQEKKGKQNKGLIILDSTSEFCRALGEAETVPSASNDDAMDEDNSEPEENNMVLDTEMDAAGGWEQVTDTAGPSKTNDPLIQDESVLDEEPVVAGSVGAALKLASMKGYLESGKKKERNFAALNLPKAKIVIDEDKGRDDDRGRYDRDRERYDPYAFKEKADYKPNIRLEYIDQHGRDLTPKEAFRYLSHKFHGKGSGKMKTEKRNKKVIDDMRLQKMSSVDTPLNLCQMMSDKQQESHTPYVVLSGGGKNLLSSQTKLKK